MHINPGGGFATCMWKVPAKYVEVIRGLSTWKGYNDGVTVEVNPCYPIVTFTIKLDMEKACMRMLQEFNEWGSPTLAMSEAIKARQEVINSDVHKLVTTKARFMDNVRARFYLARAKAPAQEASTRPEAKCTFTSE